jgi:ribosomal protein S1
MLTLFAAVVCVFAVTGKVLAEEAQKPAEPAVAASPKKAPAVEKKTSIFTGEVVSIDSTANQIVVKSKGKPEGVTFGVTERTNIRKAKKEAALTDIVAGDKVIVAYRTKDDKKIATAIKVKAPKAAKEEAKPAAPAVPAAPAK